MRHYRIGELAEKCNVNKETIRYYERKGLILETERTEGGYRLYTEETIRRIRFIKQLQGLGFTLAEIDKLLGVVDRDRDRCKDMYQFVEQKVEEIQAKIRDLVRIEAMLQQLKECCPYEDNLYNCPIIDLLLEEPSDEGRQRE
ncbi:Hg(II)-responsive transcriptional regulator [Geobacillus jurassicus]|uniref:Mercuric resistance operon regulatory protein n=1 Tax=Geobacillus jurassicus TaxID=235932 RepID=A0ABV6GTG4_9BACL|nr:Hg(II)-responsive transcriptional regulator [Geobacillus jurassicus]